MHIYSKDYNHNNITISDIQTIYYCNTNDWERPFYKKRHAHGLVLFDSGKIEYNIGGQYVIAQAGDILKLPKTIPYSGLKLTDEPNGFYTIDFSTYDDNEYEKLPFPILTKNVDFTFFEKKFKKIYETWIQCEINSMIRCKALLYDLLGDVMSAGEQKDDVFSREIIQYIVSNIGSSKLRIQDICEHFYISESQLRRKLRKATSLSPNQYITTLRINKAKNMLIYENLQIDEIAYTCGFTSAFYFSTSFKKVVGVSPFTYRKDHSCVSVSKDDIALSIK